MRWGGDVDGTAGSITYTIHKNSLATATFASNLFNIGVTTVGSGTVIRTPNQTQAYMGSTVELTAAASTGYQFQGWSGDVQVNFNPITFRADSSMAITATFIAAPPPVLHLTTAGSGTVAKNPDQPSYAVGTIVQITATPATGWRFVNWSGDFSAGENPLSVTMDRDHSLTANFAPDGFVLTSPAAGPGTVVRNPDQPTYHAGTQVTLTATPSGAAHFVGWGGDTTAVDDPLTITMTADRTLQAQFGWQLTTGSGQTGRVSASPAGGLYVDGTAVTLTPQPAPGYHFVSWTGDASGTTVPLHVTMSADKNISATFESNPYHVTAIADGEGTINRKPDLPAYDYGTVVMLGAHPAPGWHFSQWIEEVDLRNQQTIGDCAVCDDASRNPLPVRVHRDHYLTAVFEQDAFQVVVSTNGRGAVAATWQPQAGPDSTVVLQAQPEDGWTFAGWSGDAAGQTNPLRMTLARAAQFTARFVRTQTADSTAASVAGSRITAFALAPVAPNPAFGHVRLGFDMPRAADVTLDVLDIQGRRVAVLATGALNAGHHDVTWTGATTTGAALEPGVFFARLRTPAGLFTQRFAFRP